MGSKPPIHTLALTQTYLYGLTVIGILRELLWGQRYPNQPEEERPRCVGVMIIMMMVVVMMMVMVVVVTVMVMVTVMMTVIVMKTRHETCRFLRLASNLA
jgi:UDP-N-acetylmuramyl pentapeptide phosphotransferase/UDP-N-acetylglucosamine-1-phosphate transferase